MTAVEEKVRPPAVEPTNRVDWFRQRLFPNVASGLVTILLIPVVSYVGYRAFVFLFVNGRWEAVERNLTLFMQGTFPRDEQWRIVVQIVLLAVALGIGAATAKAASEDQARESGLPVVRSPWWQIVPRFWSVILFVLVLLLFANTISPWLVVGAATAAVLVGSTARWLPTRLRTFGWVLMSLFILAGFQVVSGTDGQSWVPAAIVVGLGVYSLAGFEGMEPRMAFLLRSGLTTVSAIAVYFLYGILDLPGIGWDQWSGLHLTLWVSALAIVLSFPLGLLLALARRSSLPALRFLATGYIELIRGVPLITLLFMGRYILGFMLPAGSALSDISRAIAAMTLFTAAYVAEIVRGGLQSLPYGQTEAAQALGLSPSKAMRLIILPQALRAVIPAMVGQFISLFKDSSLLEIIAINEFLGVRSLVHAQADFRSIAHAETLVFVAFGYWAFSYAMSRESQNLERRLRVSR